VNIATTSFNAMEQMTEMSQRRNYRCRQFALSEQLNQATLMQASVHTVWNYVICWNTSMQICGNTS